MKYIWFGFIGIIFLTFIYFMLPVDSSVYENYMNVTYMSSKGDFVSRRSFSVKQEIESNGGTASGIQPITDPSRVTAEAKSETGVAQGLWSNSAGVTLTSEEFATICRSIVGDADSYISLFGIAPKDAGYEQKHEVDVWKSRFNDDVGTIHYLQGDGPWGGLRHKFALPSHTSSIAGSGCGSTAMSIIFSTMLHRYITPAEVAAGVGTYNVRYGVNKLFHTPDSGAGAMDQSSELELIFQDMKFNGKSLLQCEHVSTISKDKVDATLDAGGLVMWVSIGKKGKGSYMPVWASGSGHWVVIRERNVEQGTYYCADGANTSNTDLNAERTADPNTPNTFDTIQAAAKSQVFYITKGPGYEDYINAMSRR